MKLTKKIFSIILCFVLAMSFVVAVPASATTYAVIEFSGLDLPVPNESPDFEITSLCDDYDVLNFAGNDMIIWTDEDTSIDMEYTDTFIEGHTYRVKIYFEPTSNQVEIVEGAKFMMDDSGLGWYIYEDSNGLFAQNYFENCGTIQQACIYIDEPVAGANPDFEPKHDNRFVIEGNKSPVKNGVSWYDETDDKYLVSGTTDAVFKCQHVYKVIFDLRSYTCDFDGNASLIVNRYGGKFTWAAPNFATVEYTFAELDCAPTLVEAVAPSCKSEGNIEHYACSCGKFYKDEYAIEEIADVVIPKLNHTPSSLWVIAKPATETEEGEKVKKCEVCEEIIETQAIAKLEPTQPTTEPTTKPTESTQPTTEPTTKPVESTQPTTEPTTKPVESTQPITTQKTEEPIVCTHNTTVKNSKDATYFANGYSGDKVCVKCGETIEKGTAIAKLKLAKPKFTTKAKGKKIKVSYKKVTGATGFQVRYRIKGKWIVKTFKAKKNVTKTLKKLKKGTYKVQVRAFVQSGKQKVYSPWTKKQKVKIK